MSICNNHFESNQNDSNTEWLDNLINKLINTKKLLLKKENLL